MSKALYCIAILALLPSAVAVPALAEEILGIVFGKPVTIPACPEGLSAALAPGAKCWQLLTSSETEQTYVGGLGGLIPYRFIQFVNIELIDGRVEAVHITTRGVRVQQEAFAALKEKYGKPTAYRSTTVKTMMGATFPNITASWQKPGLHVLFSGVAGQIDGGFAYIETDKYQKANPSKPAPRL